MKLTPEIEQFSLFHAGSGLFRLARPYRDALPVNPRAIQEPGWTAQTFPWTERHLQCLWADPSLRPDRLTTHDNDEVQIIDPGTWNHEAGPDFLNADLIFGPDLRRVRGDVEIHIRPAGWKQHGHHRDPAYQRVVLHVAWFPGVLPSGVLPAHCKQACLKTAMESRYGFSFDAMDLDAYPYAIPSGNEAQSILSTWTLEARQALLDAAGAERMLRKKERMQYAMDQSEPRQVLYEFLMAGLGYRKNASAFRMLARHVPLAQLQALSKGCPERVHALLLGAAGLLPPIPAGKNQDPALSVLRRLWAHWWKLADQVPCIKNPSEYWTLHGIRPLNRPERRLRAAAELFSDNRIFQALENITLDRAGLRSLEALLSCPGSSYFHRHCTFKSKPMQRPCNLVGIERAKSLLVNTCIPWAEAVVGPQAVDPDALKKLRGEPVSRLIRETAHYLFGPDHTSKIYSTALRRQGLLQIFYDFLVDRRPSRTADLISLLRTLTAAQQRSD